MNPVAFRLITRLLVSQFVVFIIAELVIAVFAPNLLLLDRHTVAASAPGGLGAGGALIALETVSTLLITRPVRPVLRALSVGSTSLKATDLVALYRIPLRITLLDGLWALLVTSATLVPPLRPSAYDIGTQVELFILTVTIAWVAALPAYVTFRASVARVLELAPPSACSEARALVDAKRRRLTSVGTRLAFAVAAPVAFVALGSSLLVLAHVRVFVTSTGESDAVELARSAFDLIDGNAVGRQEAMAQAARHGFDVQLASASARFEVRRAEGWTSIVVPLEDGHATVRLPRRHVGPVLGIYFSLGLLATLVAAFLGIRVGEAFSSDVSTVTRELKALGVDDVLKGTRVQRGVRFLSIRTLLIAIDRLADVFREFAATQERAIEARAATERMRGLFLVLMSHDLKAPLNAILGFGELASRNPLTVAQRESLSIIEQRGRELLHLIETILDSARAEAGELVLCHEHTKVGDVVLAAVGNARELALQQRVSLVGEIQPDTPWLWVDPARLTQALVSVILTAVRFAEQGIVRVRATIPPPFDMVRIDVEAPGAGLPDSELSGIFEAFKDPERARRHGSLGLGLSLARAIVALHSGVIEANANARDGTVFTLWLPTKLGSVTTRFAVPRV